MVVSICSMYWKGSLYILYTMPTANIIVTTRVPRLLDICKSQSAVKLSKTMARTLVPLVSNDSLTRRFLLTSLFQLLMRGQRLVRLLSIEPNDILTLSTFDSTMCFNECHVCTGCVARSVLFWRLQSHGTCERRSISVLGRADIQNKTLGWGWVHKMSLYSACPLVPSVSRQRLVKAISKAREVLVLTVGVMEEVNLVWRYDDQSAGPSGASVILLVAYWVACSWSYSNHQSRDTPSHAYELSVSR